MQPGRIDTGYVAHTLGWPLTPDLYGGGWIYGLRDNRVSLGMIVSLEYHNPLFDPHAGVPEIQDASLREAEFWTAENSFAMARRPFLTAAGIPCRAITWTAA